MADKAKTGFDIDDAINADDQFKPGSIADKFEIKIKNKKDFISTQKDGAPLRATQPRPYVANDGRIGKKSNSPGNAFKRQKKI
jgi:hypothetical protein